MGAARWTESVLEKSVRYCLQDGAAGCTEWGTRRHIPSVTLGSVAQELRLPALWRGANPRLDRQMAFELVQRAGPAPVVAVAGNLSLQLFVRESELGPAIDRP